MSFLSQTYRSILFAICVTASALTSIDAAHAAKFSVLHSFTGGLSDGAYPRGGLFRDKSGVLYGTTYSGGMSDQGTVFKAAPDGTSAILYSFSGGADGGRPNAGLTPDASGNLYGTTSFGGIEGCAGQSCGTVFKVSPNGSETVVYEFGGLDGDASPSAGLIADNKGNLYGTGDGDVFRLTPEGAETVLFTFTNIEDGCSPTGGLVRGKKGALYGTTAYCGNNGCSELGCGVVYRVTPQGDQAVLHEFTSGADGALPLAGLALDKDQNLFGTTVRGGGSGCYNGHGCGTVFKISPAGDETILYSFAGSSDGGNPQSGLVIDADGNLYGAAANEGKFGCGVIFKLTRAGALSVLHAFKSAFGCNPVGKLTMDRRGRIYGTTYSGGAYGFGTAFELRIR